MYMRTQFPKLNLQSRHRHTGSRARLRLRAFSPPLARCLARAGLQHRDHPQTSEAGDQGIAGLLYNIYTTPALVEKG